MTKPEQTSERRVMCGTRRFLAGLTVALVLSPASLAQEANEESIKVVVPETAWGPPAFMKRFEALNIEAECLPQDDLFREKRLFLYDAVVLPSSAAISKSEFEDIKIFVTKGGLFIPFAFGGTIMDANGDRKITLPPDIVVSGKSRGPFYELTGGMRIGGTHYLHGFTILHECPITEGFKVGERFDTGEKGIVGVCALWAAEGTLVCCGNATAMSGGKTERSKQASMIQVKKHGKGAGIWIVGAVYSTTEPWADRLLKNVFSRKTLAWCRQLP